MNDRSTSKFLSLILRHKPEVIGITLDEHGWADVNDLIDGVRRSRPFDMEDLERIVKEDGKQRYCFNEDRTKIRANQGHSIPVDVELKEADPPGILYHGTGEKSADSIEREGLRAMKRLYVHLSDTYDKAIRVGMRHGRPVVYAIDAQKMKKDGCIFYLSVNGVWLTKEVPLRYLSRFGS